MGITHKKIATLDDEVGAEVNKAEWNDTHDVTDGSFTIAKTVGLQTALLRDHDSYSYIVYKDGATTYARNGTTGVIDFSNTNSATVINQCLTGINTAGGGWIHVKKGTYSITTALVIPDSGALIFSGEGADEDGTVLQVPTGSDNNLFEFTGVKTVAAFFNVFKDFQGYGNDVDGTNNTGFKLDSTDFGVIDTLWDNVFLWHFKLDDMYLGAVSLWNNKIRSCVIETAGRAGIYLDNELAGGGQDVRITDTKFLFCKTYAIYGKRMAGLLIANNWFHRNDKDAIVLTGGTPGTTYCQNFNITGNRFDQNNFVGTTNTYSDIDIISARRFLIQNNIFMGGGAKVVKYFVKQTNFNVSFGIISDNNMWGAPGTSRILELANDDINETIIYNNHSYTSANDFVRLRAPQTLTVKTLNLASNTVSGTTAEFNNALSDDDFATLGGTETITGEKTFGTAGGAVSKLKVAGATSGSTIVDATAVAGSGTVTLPTTGTLATLAGSETLTNKSLSGLTNTLTNMGTPLDFIRTGGVSWYCGEVTVGTGYTATTSVNTLRAVPLIVRKGFAIDRIQIDIVGSGGAGNIVFGIYNSKTDGTLYPDTLLVQGTAHDATVLGLAVDTISSTLVDNTLYWLVYNTSVACTVRGYAIAGQSSILGSSGASSTTSSNVGWKVTLTYNATLPATYTAGGTIYSTGTAAGSIKMEVRAT